MSWISAVLFAVSVILTGAYVLHLYRRREPAAPGVGALALLRIGALAVVLLLLLDPTVPVASALGGGDAWVLLDGSRSMGAPAGPDSPWARGLRMAEGAAGGATLVFGGDPRPLASLEIVGAPPFPTSRLVPALERAAESGARRVRIVSDLRIEDGDGARAVADRLGLEVVVERLGGGVRSAGVGGFRFEGPLEGDQPVAAEASVFAVGTSPTDSVTLEIREEDRLVASLRLPVPDEGRLERVAVELPAPGMEGEVRYSARVVLSDDAFPADDERVALADVDPDEGNLVLVSTEPDWELRFLLPVLQRVTGLPARGFVRVGADRYLVMEPGGAGGTTDRAGVEALVTGAEMLVVQAAGVPSPWMEEALATVRRSVVLARGAPAARAVGVEVGAPRPGEWYAAAEIPPSPLAGELGGVDLGGLPPLADVLPLVSDRSPGPVPLELRLGSGREPEAALVLLIRPDGARSVVALASGFWRWAFREGAGRDSYERLWSGVAGWLLADAPLARGPGIRPEERVVAVGAPMWWSASGLVENELAFRLFQGDTTVLDTTLTVPGGGRFQLTAPGEGSYRWEAARTGGTVGGLVRGEAPGVEGSRGDTSTADLWEGRLEVEGWTDDLRHPRDTLLARSGGGGRDTALGGSPGRPLRTHPLPYLLVLALLSAEWFGRRRRGLR